MDEKLYDANHKRIGTRTKDAWGNDVIKDMNGRDKYKGQFTVPIKLMTPTGQRNKFTLVTTSNIQSMTLK